MEHLLPHHLCADVLVYGNIDGQEDLHLDHTEETCKGVHADPFGRIEDVHLLQQINSHWVRQECREGTSAGFLVVDEPQIRFAHGANNIHYELELI
jgi:hypothetical protein